MKNIQAGVEKGRYREASDVYTDLSLVFWNALFYNESDSQIALDAGSLKVSSTVLLSLGYIALSLLLFLYTLNQNLLETEWTKRSVLPRLRTSPPPSSAQKVHAVAAESKNMTLPPPPVTPARTVTPAEQVPNASSDPDVDVTTPESDGPEEDEPAAQTDRDPQSDEIIKGSMKGVKGPVGIVNVPVGNGSNGGGAESDNTRKKLRSPGRTVTQQQQQQQQPPPPAPATTTPMATLQTTHATQSQNPYQLFQQPYVQQQQQQMVNQPQTQRSTTLGPDRSIITAAGGIAAIGGPSQVEKLPADTGKFFFWTFCSPAPFPLGIWMFSFLLLTTCLYIYI